MADDAQTQRTRGTLSKTRMEAFSDGVLAIAITLLVTPLGSGSDVKLDVGKQISTATQKR